MSKERGRSGGEICGAGGCWSQTRDRHPPPRPATHRHWRPRKLSPSPPQVLLERIVQGALGERGRPWPGRLGGIHRLAPALESHPGKQQGARCTDSRGGGGGEAGVAAGQQSPRLQARLAGWLFLSLPLARARELLNFLGKLRRGAEGGGDAEPSLGHCLPLPRASRLLSGAQAPPVTSRPLPTAGSPPFIINPL